MSEHSASCLKIAVAGGGPVGLAFALMLRDAIPDVKITIFDRRWQQQPDEKTVEWQKPESGTARRQQVVTIQSRQYTMLSELVQKELFAPGKYSEMWPIGPDSVNELPPRNVRLSDVEDVLLDLVKKDASILLRPEAFDVEGLSDELKQFHLLVVAHGASQRSEQTRVYFDNLFGEPGKTLYTLKGEHLQDVVLGLRVKSKMSDPLAVVLTIAQNRFLLNSLHGEGFLNVRLSRNEVKQVKGVIIDDDGNFLMRECIQSSPCLMEKREELDPNGDGAYKYRYCCPTHKSLFLPQLLIDSAVMNMIKRALEAFQVDLNDLTAITAFRLEMVQRSRFTSVLFEPTNSTPGTYACLIGDAANAIHFWPGRGLNSGLASANSLVRTIKLAWQKNGFRDADFMRHEGAMAMLQHRHKTRAWRQMVAVDPHDGSKAAIKDLIEAANSKAPSPAQVKNDASILKDRMLKACERLEGRLENLPSCDEIAEAVERIDGATLRAMVASGPWETRRSGGEEVDLDQLWPPGRVSGDGSPAQTPVANTAPNSGNVPPESPDAKSYPSPADPHPLPPQSQVVSQPAGGGGKDIAAAPTNQMQSPPLSEPAQVDEAGEFKAGGNPSDDAEPPQTCTPVTAEPPGAITPPNRGDESPVPPHAKFNPSPAVPYLHLSSTQPPHRSSTRIKLLIAVPVVMFAVVVGAQQYFRDHDTPIRALDPTPIASVATNSQPQRQLIASEVASRASSVPTIPNKMSAPTKQQNKHIGLEDALKENAN